MRGVEIKDDGRALVFGQFLRELLAIHEHYKAGSERLVAFAGERFGRTEIYEATVTRHHLAFEVKVVVSDDGVREIARAEV
ncbi:MAG: hypothetical protein JNL41_10015 [Phenylobacterium sp.]|uniref:hypothetical protein n=1 Tax=Phenylobacterium sp. TaxID=1871053 RepID=UPI001A3FC283|nr:hypothetical protein [Phenylobacterium sp.]MBL8554601.1 hypothetical protein [Phenylobacterium sp.]